jgi:hypothetical protein
MIVSLILTLALGAANATDLLETAKTQLSHNQELDARKTLEKAKPLAAADPALLAQIHLYLGLTYAASADQKHAVDSFRTALKLDKKLELPDDTPPKVLEWWLKAGGKPPPTPPPARPEAPPPEPEPKTEPKPQPVEPTPVAKPPPPQPAPVAPPAPEPAPEEDRWRARGFYVDVAGVLQGFSTKLLVGRRFGDAGTGRTEAFDKSSSPLGFEVTFGHDWTWFCLELFSAELLGNQASNLNMSVNYAPGAMPEMKDGVAIGDQITNVSYLLLEVAALTPGVHYSFGRLALKGQVGLEFRTGKINGTVPGGGAQYTDGFTVTDLMIAARLKLTVMITQGLYAHLTGGWNFVIAGCATQSLARSADSLFLALGLGWHF